MLSMLLDEMISSDVSEQVAIRRPEISIQSIFHWRAGSLLSEPDYLLLQAASEDGLTLVTYDQRTILPLASAWYAAGRTHEGIVFVSESTIRSRDFGRLVRAIEQFWDREHQHVWANRIDFLRAP